MKLSPNRTQFLQPTDSLINPDFQSRIRKNFTGWWVKNFANVHCKGEEEAKEEHRDPKNFFQPPPKEKILKEIWSREEDMKKINYQE